MLRLADAPVIQIEKHPPEQALRFFYNPDHDPAATGLDPAHFRIPLDVARTLTDDPTETVDAIGFSLMVLLLLLFPARYTGTAALWGILAWYGLAKLLELLDRAIYAANGVVSGHTLKHLVASLGALWVLLMLQQRRPLSPGSHQRGSASPCGTRRDTWAPISAPERIARAALLRARTRPWESVTSAACSATSSADRTQKASVVSSMSTRARRRPL